MPPEELIGQSLGNYSILRSIGQGGMATVFLATDTHLQREVAIKVFSPRSHDNETFMRRFAREAKVVARLDHPNILAIYDYGEQDGIAYFVMPYLTHGSLHEHLQKQKMLPIADALKIIIPILHALQYAHQHNYIHRDIKPGNILFKDDNTPVLGDFGLVKFIRDEATTDALVSAEITRTGDVSIMGTPQYMAPEQIQGRASRASDIYSVGAVLYEMLTGTPPFSAKNTILLLSKHLYEQPHPLRSLNPSIPLELDRVVSRALKKNEAERYPTPDAFIAALTDMAWENQTPHTTSTPLLKPSEEEPTTPLMTTHMQSSDEYRTVYRPDTVTGNELAGAAKHNPTPSLPAQTERSRPRRLWTLLIALCLVLVVFASLGTWYLRMQSGPAAIIKSTSTPVKTTRTTSKATATAKDSIVAATLPTYETSCPSTGQVRKPTLLNLSKRGNDPQLIYYSHFYDAINQKYSGALVRYSATNSNKVTLLQSDKFSIDQAVLSPDKQWILFSTSVSGQPAKLQMLRIDGQGLQTLYCTSDPVQINQLSWSHFDEVETGHVFFDTWSNAIPQPPLPSQAYQLDIQHGTLIQEKLAMQNINQVIPIGWSSSTSVYLKGTDNSVYLYTLATNGKPAQSKLIHRGSSCDSYSQNATTSMQDLIMSHCIGMGNGSCSGGCSNSGPSTITDLNTNTTLYTSQDQAIVAINAIGNGAYLTLVRNINAARESPDNGLYLLDQDHHLTSIRKNDGSTFFFSQQSNLDIFCSSQYDCPYYALRLGSTQAVGMDQLAFGPTNGNGLTPFAQSQTASLSIAGWTQD
ncbi:hypothetical protein KDW_55750 [Dictyobacter vulcani]|uniref:non-specific serine/threonine protein kinase n=1 Tax=Dictyobacter vulcani TaxID=2607529 RepID=A0A5J4KUY9_9CHLR|nr:serine/threonine-protein kinase [Dictyobacter vulcani]GER91413.1 hypothetical protein KDW_55750 [Dictyobacter vulcani]